MLLAGAIIDPGRNPVSISRKGIYLPDDRWRWQLRVLVIGAGVIGTVYGAQLAAAGHPVSVLRHGPRTDEVAHLGLVARDVVDHTSQTAPVELVAEAGAGSYDLVLISVWATQLPAVIDDLRRLSGAPALLFFGNNPTGRAALPGDLPGTVHLGFPGIGGSMAGGAAEYLRVPQQPTTLQTGGGHWVAQFEAVLHSRGFAVTRTPEMDGWLAYHGVLSPRSRRRCPAAKGAPSSWPRTGPQSD